MTPSGSHSDPPGATGPRRLSKNQRRLTTILAKLPMAREQLLVAMEDLGPSFTLTSIETAAQSADPRERNKVATVERELDVLIGWLEELAFRCLAEGERLGVIDRESGSPWDRLAALDVISQNSADRLKEVKDDRNELAHDYPLASWSTLHAGVETLLDELDAYKVKLATWAQERGILPGDA